MVKFSTFLVYRNYTEASPHIIVETSNTKAIVKFRAYGKRNNPVNALL